MIYMIFLITMILWIASFLAMTQIVKQKAESLTSLAWGIALRSEIAWGIALRNHSNQINHINHSSEKKIKKRNTAHISINK